MAEAIENYINWFPQWYSMPSVFMFVFCGYSFVWAIGDDGRFGGFGNFYRRRAIRSFIGAMCAASILLWPVPMIAWLIFNAIPNWNKSELDQLSDYMKAHE